MEDLTNAPDPLEVVSVLKSDFDLLQAAATAAMDDYIALTDILGIERPEGVAPRQVMYDAVFPVIIRLVQTQHGVAQAGKEIVARAAELGNQTIELPGGKKGLLVGRKVQGLFDGLKRG